jgi:hypothetical protein
VLLVIVGAVAYGMRGSSADPNKVAGDITSDFNSGQYQSICTLAEPSEASKCRTEAAGAGLTGIKFHVTPGSVATSGNEGLFAMTGTACGSQGCVTNTKGLSALEGGKSFSQEYTFASNPNTSNNFWVVPLVEQNGKWYLTGF